MLSVEIDFRERNANGKMQEMFEAFIQQCTDERHNIALKPCALPTGDIRIVYNGECLWLAERKTLPDLLASFSDARYKEQKARLRILAEEFPACRVCYLLEAEEFCNGKILDHPDPRAPAGYLSLVNTKLHHICLPNMEESVKYVCALAVQFKKWIDTSGKPREITHSKPSLSKRDCKTPCDSAIAALTAIEGVSVERAKAILKTFGSLGLIARASRDQIANVIVEPIGGNAKCRKIGPKVAERVETVFTARHNGFPSPEPPQKKQKMDNLSKKLGFSQ